MIQLLLIALATFVSEDLTCVATGGLIAAGKLGWLPGVLACTTGIFAGDLLLYLAGRFVGRPLVRWRLFRRLLTPEKLDRASQWLSDRGARVVILSRFSPGLRLPTYVAAGLLKTRFWTFAGYFLVASLLWTPLLVSGVAFVGRRTWTLGAVAIGVGLVFQDQRRVASTWRRLARWEFWPPWLAYMPVVPYVLYLGVKHRSLTLFTAANPGIPSGGFVGESKSDILSKLKRVAPFTLIDPTFSPRQRVIAAQDFISQQYPVVLKPDVGQRGAGVTIARNDNDVTAYLNGATGDTIIQKYVSGLEYGIFYYRYPGESAGRIFSITRKLFPHVVGDGKSTVADLIRSDERAVFLADLYLARLKRRATDVPRSGESVALTELGSHCLGAIFLDGARLETIALRRVVDDISKAHAGFYFGRFDVRAESVEALQAGHFEVLELNGVSSEATHIYDPSVSMLEAYRVMYRQWKIAFEIGAINRALGATPMPLKDLVRLLRPKRPAVARRPTDHACQRNWNARKFT